MGRRRDGDSNVRKPSVFLGYVHPDMIPHLFMEALGRQLRDAKIISTIAEEFSGPLIAQARNRLVKRFLETRCDYFLSVDSDIVWMPDDIHRLVADDKDIVSGLYISRNPLGTFPVYMDLVDGAYIKAVSVPEGLTEIGAAGTGFCLIQRKVLMKLGVNQLWPYAEVLNPRTGASMTEDVTFSERAKAEGFELWLDPQVKVGHLKLQVMGGRYG
jgi:GT2 family glycosyltransferase